VTTATVAACGEGLFLVASHRVRGQGDDDDVARARVGLQTARQLVSVRAGELQIHQDHPRVKIAQELQRLLRIGRPAHLVALRREQIDEEPEVGVVVLDHQD
jgi:hypothetical protein